MSLLAKKVQNGEVDKEEMTAHVSTFAYVWNLSIFILELTKTSIAGGETVSTFLAGTTCILLQHPDKLALLVSEIRGAFKSYEDIDAQAAQKLSYLQAVIHEGLRLFPPGPSGAARISPGFELHGKYVPAGVR